MMKWNKVGLSLSMFAMLALVGCKQKKVNPVAKATAAGKTKADVQKTAKVPSGQGSDKALMLQGKRIAKSTFLALKKELGKAMKQGGPTAAVKTCKVKATPVTAAMSKKHKVVISRVSHKARNPQNAASVWERALIAKYAAAKSAKKPLKPTLRKVKGKTVFYAPIALNNGLCLVCHGAPKTVIAPPLYKLIRSLYPNDKAVNFKLGEMRGLWKIEFAQK